MKKSSALLLSLVVTLVFLNTYFTLNGSSVKKFEEVKVSRIIDGDTIETSDGLTIRLANINAPEKGQLNSNLSKSYLLSLNGILLADYLGRDKYGRYLARLYSGSDYINLKMVELGFSSKFLVQDDEKEEFSLAEKEAIKNGIGIWEHSEFYGCFSTEIDKKSEAVTFIMKCPVKLDGWFVKDESRKRYVFKNFAPSTIFILKSDEGNDSINILYWKSLDEIWNDDSDSLYLFDNEWKIAHYDTY